MQTTQLLLKGWVFISTDNGAAEAGPGLAGPGRESAYALHALSDLTFIIIAKVHSVFTPISQVRKLKYRETCPRSIFCPNKSRFHPGVSPSPRPSSVGDPSLPMAPGAGPSGGSEHSPTVSQGPSLSAPRPTSEQDSNLQENYE